MYHIFIVSDGTGRTAEQALNAALMQFPHVPLEFHRKTNIRTPEAVLPVIAEAKKKKAFILHTLVQDEVRHTMIREARKHNVDTIDLMGPLLSRLSHQFENAPSEKPGIFHQLNREYFDRIDSMQFAINHDDGLRTQDLDKAEIVLIGVSRTFKTPISIYLAFKGWFVANIPIVLNVQPPSILFKIPPEKVFFLTTKPHQLSTLRQFRKEAWGENAQTYADFEHVRKELIYAHQIYKRQPKWTMIRVTSKPIEEIASEILAIRGTDSRRPDFFV